MSTFPLRDLRQVSPNHPLGRRWLWFTVIPLAVAALVYSGTLWTWFRPVVHKQLINKYAGAYKIDPLWAMAIIKVESGFASAAHSRRGALGLMQLLPSTARQIAPEIGIKNLSDEDLTNPDINLHLGFHYLAKLQREFPDEEVAVLAAYNAGPGITEEWHKGRPALELEDVSYAETRRFVERVEGTYMFLKAIQRWKNFLGIE